MTIKENTLPLDKIEAVFSDIDGTLLNSKGEMTERTMKAIRNLPIPFIFASERYIEATDLYYNELDLATPRIVANGAAIYDKDRRAISAKFLDSFAIKSLTRGMRDQSNDKLCLSLFTLNSWFCNEKMGKEAREKPTQYCYPSLYTYDLSLFPMLTIVKFEASGSSKELEANRRIWRAFCSTFNMYQENPNKLEVFPKGVSKGTGVVEVCKYVKMNTHNVLGIGDKMIDKDLLEACGVKAAMGNADEGLKAMADIVVPHTDEDGLAQLIEAITEAKRAAANSN